MQFITGAATTLRIDTVRAFVKVKRADIHTNPNYRFTGYTDNTTNYLIVLPETNYGVRVTHTFGKAYFEFSLPRLTYTDNHQLVTVEQAEASIKRLSELAGLPVESFNLTRLDITYDIAFKPTSLLSVEPQLQAPKYHLPVPIRYTNKETGKRNGNFEYRSKPVKVSSASETKRSKKSTLVYAKGEKVRIETRLRSAATIKAAFDLGDTDLKVNHLFTEAFAELSRQYYTKIVTEMTSKNPEHKLVKGFRKVALEVLPTGLLH